MFGWEAYVLVRSGFLLLFVFIFFVFYRLVFGCSGVGVVVVCVVGVGGLLRLFGRAYGSFVVVRRSFVYYRD